MSNEYTSPFSILEDTHEAINDAIKERANMRFKHSEARIALWPSMASIELTEPDEYGKFHTRVEGSCIRQGYYYSKQVEPTDHIQKRAIDSAEVGKAVELIYVRRFKNLHKYRVIWPDINEDQLRFATKLGIRGELDIILQHHETGIKFGVEMKSYDGHWKAMEYAGYDAAKACYKGAMPYIRKYLDKSRKVPNPQITQEPFPSIQNLLQTMLYLEEFWDDGIRLWKIIYAARDKGPEVEHDITLAEYDGKRCAVVNGVIRPQITLEGVHARYQLLKAYVDQDTVPPRDYVPEYDFDYVMADDSPFPEWVKKKVKGGEAHRDWRCDFCPFLQHCLMETDGAPF